MRNKTDHKKILLFLLAGTALFVLSLVVTAAALVVDWEPSDTIMVASSGGDYTSIGEALQKAPANARIRVLPGVYHERLSITKPVEIIGSTNDDSIVSRVRRILRRDSSETIIESNNSPAVILKSERASLKSLKLRSIADANDTPFPTVVVAGGNLNLADCKISSERYFGIGVAGPTSSCSLNRCVVAECGLNGVFALNQSQLVVENCEFLKNKFSGVRVQSEARAIVRSSKFREGEQGGVLALNHAYAAIEGCDFYGNQLGAVEVRENGKVRVANSTIRHNEESAVLVHYDGVATLYENDIFNSSNAGITVCDKGSAEIYRCKIHDIRKDAVEVYANSNALFDACKVSGNIGAGFAIWNVSTMVMRHCETENNTRRGIEVHFSTPLVQNCTIRDGVTISDNSEGVYEDCEFVSNRLNPVVVRKGAKPLVQRCIMRDGLAGGVYVENDSGGTIEDCEMYGNRCAGVGIARGGNPIVRRCKINRNGEPAIRLFEDALGRIEDCDLTDNVGGAWSFEGKNRVIRNNNREK